MEQLIQLMKTWEDTREEYLDVTLYSNGSGQLATENELVFSFDTTDELIEYLTACI